jgi:hypothetical protein
MISHVDMILAELHLVIRIYEGVWKLQSDHIAHTHVMRVNMRLYSLHYDGPVFRVVAGLRIEFEIHHPLVYNAGMMLHSD